MDSVVLPTAQTHAAEPRSAAAPTAGPPPSPPGCATYGPRAPPGPVTILFILAGRAPPFPLAVFQSQCREGGVPSLGRASVELGMSGHHNPLSFRLCRSNIHITSIFYLPVRISLHSLQGVPFPSNTSSLDSTVPHFSLSYTSLFFRHSFQLDPSNYLSSCP